MINKSVLLNSGDVLNIYSTSKRLDPLLSPASQVEKALTSNLVDSLQLDENNSPVFDHGLNIVRLGTDKHKYPRTTCCRYPKCHELTLKVFVHDASFQVDRCLSLILDELSFTYVDNLIVSFDESLSQSEIDSIWSGVVNEKKLGRASAIGVADFCLHKLKQLNGQTPDIDQLAPERTSGFCGISSDLVSYARDHGIKLRSHGDGSCASMSGGVETVLMGRSLFTARYSQSSKDRLALTKRGFFHYVEL